MEYYYFWRQYEKHFKTAGVKSHKCVFFAASFLRAKINFCWQKYKTWIEQDRVAFLKWDKFKVFLQKSLGKSTAFINNIWGKIKIDS